MLNCNLIIRFIHIVTELEFVSSAVHDKNETMINWNYHSGKCKYELLLSKEFSPD